MQRPTSRFSLLSWFCVATVMATGLGTRLIAGELVFENQQRASTASTNQPGRVNTTAPVKRSVRMNGPLRIVAFGDSITNGVGLAGVNEADTFRDIVRRELTKRLGSKVDVVNAGVNGDIVPLAIGRLKRDVLDRKPDIVTIMFGGNEAGFPDGLHPDARGHRVIADLLVQRLVRIIDRGPLQDAPN